MTHKKLLLLGALALVAFAAGCGSDECSADTDCASKGSNFVCTNGTCVQHTPKDGGTTCSPACSGATPICNQSTLTCVACTQDSECGGETPSCDIAHNTCVACSNNTDCQDSADGPACDTATHTCVACTANTDCSGATPTCDTTAHTCVACVSNGDCTDASAPACDTATNTCVACVGNSDCTDDAPVCDTTAHTCGCSADADCADSAAGHACDTTNHVCVACNDSTQCSGTTPVCDTANHTCTAACTGDPDCAATPATPKCNTTTSVCVACLGNTDCSGATPACDTTTNTCVECAGATDCASSPAGGACDLTSHTCGCAVEADCAGTTGTPTCNTSTHACVAACTLQTDCSISQDCTDGGQGKFCTNVDVAAASTAIDAIKTAAAAGTTVSTQAVTGAIVTYVKPAVGAEAAAFFVQAEAAGPALYVAVDPGTLSPSPVVGDRVSFTATTLAYVNKQAQVTALSGLTVITSGHQASSLLTDVSAATDLVSALDTYDSRLIGMGFTVSATPTTANSGYMAALVTTAGMPSGSGSLKFYAPSTIFSGLDVTNGCTAQITNGVMFRYNNTAEPAVWGTSDLTVSSCPQPKLLSAARTSATEVDLTFDRNIDPSTINAAYFVITETATPLNTLSVTNATFDSNDSRKVILTTASQTPGMSYTVTVAPTVKDDFGAGQGVDPTANTATFNGFVGPAVLRITEVNPNIASAAGGDLLELVVTSGGALDNMKVIELSGSSVGTVFAFPAGIIAQTNDVILLHLYSNATTNTCSETSGKAQCAAGGTGLFQYGDTWWDFVGTGGFGYSGKVVAVQAADGSTLLTAAAWFKSGTTTSAHYGNAMAQIEAAGLWTGSGSCVDDTTTAACQADAANWGGLGAGTDTSAQRGALTDPGSAAQWMLPAAGGATFGTYP